MNTERFQNGLVRRASGCLEWTGGINPKGYGRVRVDGKRWQVHCFAWTLAHGPIPEGLYVLHHCDNPPCCDAVDTEHHLFLGTLADNNADMRAKGRQRNGQRTKTHCPQKHAYDETNTYIDSRGWRQCRVCCKSRMQAARAKRLVR